MTKEEIKKEIENLLLQEDEMNEFLKEILKKEKEENK